MFTHRAALLDAAIDSWRSTAPEDISPPRDIACTLQQAAAVAEGAQSQVQAVMGTAPTASAPLIRAAFEIDAMVAVMHLSDDRWSRYLGRAYRFIGQAVRWPGSPYWRGYS